MKTPIYKTLISLYTWFVIAGATVLTTISIAISRLLFGLFDRDVRIGHAIGYLWGDTIVASNPFWKMHIHGAKNIKKGRPYVLVSNHASMADIVVIYKLHRQFKWVARDDLFRVPFLGWSMRLLKYIQLERGRHGSIKKSFGEAQAWINKGMPVLFFPEGTRSRNNELGPFKNGAFKLAIESQVPIVPIVIRNSFYAIPRGTWIFDHLVEGDITVFPPIETRNMQVEDADRLKDSVHNLMREHIEKNPWQKK